MTVAKVGGKAKGSPKTGGRQKGTPNKATAEVKAAAMKYAPSAIKTLADLMVNAESEQARVSAANAILDRAVGKPKQTLANDDENPLMPHEAVLALLK